MNVGKVMQKYNRLNECIRRYFRIFMRSERKLRIHNKHCSARENMNIKEPKTIRS